MPDSAGIGRRGRLTISGDLRSKSWGKVSTTWDLWEMSSNVSDDIDEDVFSDIKVGAVEPALDVDEGETVCLAGESLGLLGERFMILNGAVVVVVSWSFTKRLPAFVVEEVSGEATGAVYGAVMATAVDEVG